MVAVLVGMVIRPLLLVMDQHLKLVVERRVIRELVQATELVITTVLLELNLVVSKALVVVEVELELPTQVVLEMEVVDNLVL